MATAGSIVVDLLMRTGSFETDTKRAEQRFKGMEKSIDQWAKRITATTLVAGAAFGAWAVSVSRSMDATLKMAQQIGVTTEALTGLRYATQQFANVSDQQFDMSMRRMTRRIAEAAAGSGAAKGALEAMGLSAKELARLSPDQQILAIADGLQQTDRQAQRLRHTMAIFDSEGMALVPALQQGSAELSKYVAEAERFGLVVSTEAAQAAAEFQTQLSRIGSVMSGISIGLANQMLPLFEAFTGELLTSYTRTDDLADAVRELGRDTTLKQWIIDIGRLLSTAADIAIYFTQVAVRGLQMAGANINMIIAGYQLAKDAATSLFTGQDTEAAQQQFFSRWAEWKDSFGNLSDTVVGLEFKVTSSFDSAVAKLLFDQSFVGPRLPTELPAIPVFGDSDDDKKKPTGTDPLASFRARLAEAQELTAALKAYGLAVDDMLPSERELLKLQGQMGLAVKDRVGKLSDATLSAQIAITKETAAQEKLAKQLRQTLEMRKEYIDGILDQNAKVYTSITELEDRVATWAMTDEQTARNIEALTQARVRERIAIEEAALARQLLSGAGEDDIAVTQRALALLRQQLEYREREAELNETIRRQMEDRRAFERTVSQWTDTVRAIDDVFRQGFADMLNEGEGSWKAFTKSMATTFKTTVADTLYKAFAQPFVVRVVAQMAGLISGPAVGQEVLKQSGVGGTGGLGWMTNFSGSLKDSIYNLSEPLARMDGLLGDIGKGIFDNAGKIADFAGKAGSVLSYGKAIFDITQGKWGSGIGTAIGQFAGGPIGAAIGSMLGGFLDDAFSGESRYGGTYQYRPGEGTQRPGWERGDPGPEAMRFADSLLSSASDAIQRAFSAAGSDVLLTALEASFESSEKGRGGTHSGGTLIIDGHEISFGTFAKGQGHGGTSGDLQEMMRNAEIDTYQTVIQALQAGAGEFPRIIRESLSGVNADAMGLEEAQAYAQSIITTLEQIGALANLFSTLPFVPAIAGTRDYAAALAEAAGSAENAATLFSSFYQNYYSEAERAAWLTEQLTAQFADLGMTLPQTREEFRALVEANMALGEAGAQTVAAMLGMESALSSLLPAFDAITESASTLDDAFDASLATARALAQEAQRLLGVRTAGGNLVDRIDTALGRSPMYAAQREAELWAALQTASYDQQISLAGELTDMVLERYQIEVDGISRVRDISRSLRDYLASLSTSELAPTNLATKVSEAERQLNEAVAKARAGDETALQQVQGLTQNALELWRRYGASGDAYQDAYHRITGMVGNLADSAQSEAERQLSVSSDSLAQLEQLRGIADSATSIADQHYQQSIAALAQETELLTSLGQDTGRLHEIADLLGGMPAQIAAQLQPILSSAMGSTVAQWYADAGYGAGDAEGNAYWQNQLGSKPAEQVQGDFMASIVTGWYAGLGRAPDPQGLAYWVDEALNKGAQEAYENFLASARIDGSHRNGLWSVPFDGYRAELHREEAVLPAVEARAWRSSQGTQGNAELVAEVKALREEVTLLREQNNQGNAGIVNATRQSGDGIADAISKSNWEREIA